MCPYNERSNNNIRTLKRAQWFRLKAHLVQLPISHSRCLTQDTCIQVLFPTTGILRLSKSFFKKVCAQPSWLVTHYGLFLQKFVSMVGKGILQPTKSLFAPHIRGGRQVCSFAWMEEKEREGFGEILDHALYSIQTNLFQFSKTSIPCCCLLFLRELASWQLLPNQDHKMSRHQQINDDMMMTLRPFKSSLNYFFFSKSIKNS